MLHSLHWNLPGGPLFWDEQQLDISAFTASLISELQILVRKHRLVEVVLNTSPLGLKLDDGCLREAGFVKQDTRFTHLLNIQRGYDFVWEAFHGTVRRAIRKSTKSGVYVRISESEKDMRTFYTIYLSLMKRFKSTPKPYSLLSALQRSPIGRLAIAEHNNRIIGGMLFLHFNKVTTVWMVASLAEDVHLRPNNAIYDFTIRWACENGYYWVDFGASPPERVGLIKFKENWSAEKYEFCVYQWLRSAWRYGLWSCAEPFLRRIYGQLQRLGYRRQLEK
jgi:lipid II:glycine glycyltransferase (peptidoglycan interpeptide bridge formation enzyme)